MKNDRTRAGRKAARRYNVSPVARAVRGVLSLSAVALMFSGASAALAKSPGATPPAPIAPIPTERARLTHEFAPVMDLTRVGDESTPKSVVEEGFDTFAPSFGSGDTMFVASEGDTGYMAAVADLTTLLPGTYHAGPGGVSGAANVVGITFDRTGVPTQTPAYNGTRTDVSTDGFATSVFISSGTDVVIDINPTTVTTTGQTWAAAWEIEGAGDVTVNHDAPSTATATVTGDDGVAFALYANGATGATVNNSGTLVATGTGARSYATGMLAMSHDGDAAVNNTGTITATSYVAIGARAYSYLGDATATNAAGDTITAKGDAASVGLWAYSYYGTATVDNAGTIDSSANIARGAWADGAYAVGINSGTIGAYGDAEAIGVQARGFYTADVDNTGTILASATGDAFGIHSQALFDASATNGIGATVTATAVDGDAYGALVAGQRGSATANNFGTLDADGGAFAAGIAAIAGTTVNVLNEGTIDATANGPEGFAVGVIAIAGGDVIVDNDGRIDATGFFATGVDVRAGGNVSVDTAYNIDVEGFDATGISASTTGENKHVDIINSGRLYASSDTSAYGGFATGIAGVARGYLGSVSIGNGSQVLADAKYGDAQGVVASADMDAIVNNTGMIGAAGGTSAYGVLALSADGDTIVDNRGGIVAIAMDGREGTAYAVAVQTNTGRASVTNDGGMYAIGAVKATGVYASALWGDAQITNNAMLGASGKYGNATGAIAISYTGDATVFNMQDGTTQVQAAGDASGLRAISLYGNANVISYGEVVVEADGRARGLTARSVYGDAAVIVNIGTVAATGGSSAWGAWALADYYGNTYVENTGAGVINATATSGDAIGVRAGAAYDVIVTNDGLIDANGYNSAIGVLAVSYDGNATVHNRAGTINAHGGGSAIGVYGVAYGVVDLTNGGTIHASADGGAAFGMLGYGGVAKVFNDGDVIATVGSGSAFGLYGFGTTASYVTNGVADTIYASATNGDAIGAFSAGLHAYATNMGSISAIGSDSAVGLESHGVDDGSGGTVLTISYNNGEIYAFATDSKYGAAMGVLATSDGDAIVTNGIGGTMYVRGSDAYGVLVAGDVSASADNHGDIAAMSTNPMGSAFGMFAYGGDTAGLGNDGTIYSGGKYAAGMAAYSHTRTANAGNAALGSVNAKSYAGQAIGMIASSDLGDSNIGNSGTVIAESVQGAAVGVASIAGATAFVRTDAGSLIDAHSTYGAARGMDLVGDQTKVYSNGDIAVSAGLSAAGIVFDADSGATIVNDGAITVVQTGAQSNGGNPPPLDINDGNAFGIVGYTATGLASVDNGGTIDVSAYGIATGIAVSSKTGGDIAVSGHGALNVDALHGNATGINVVSVSDTVTTNVSVMTEGDTDVHAGVASAWGVVATGGNVTIDNSGAMNVMGYGFAVGMDAFGTANTSISNTGTLTVGVAVPAGGNAVGIEAYGETGLSIANGGDIDVDSSERAVGIAGYTYGLLSLSNAGNIDAASTGTVATGAQLISDGGIVVDSQGNITAIAGEFASGIGGHASGGDVTIANGGAIAATAANVAYGVQMFSDGGGSVAVNNTGSINADANRAMGVRVDGYGLVSTINHGDIAAHGGQMAIGAALFGDSASIQNIGTVVGAATDAGYGVVGVGDASLYFRNSGQVDGSASADDGFAAAAILDAATITASNTGDMGATALGTLASATVLMAHGGDVAVRNEGTLTAHAGDQAFGAQLIAEGNASFENFGDINAVSANTAFGVMTSGVDVESRNSGNIAAFADGFATGVSVRGDNVLILDLGNTFATADESAYGIFAMATGTLEFHGSGTIDATAEGAEGDAVGLFAMGTNALVRNAGTISADATADLGTARAVIVDGDAVDFQNDGTISANALDFAIGVVTYGAATNRTVNSGTGVIDATGGTLAVALGGYGVDVTVLNSGDVNATADYEAIGVKVRGETSTFENGGHVTATASGLEGNAYAVEVFGFDTAFVNSHEIGALAEGENGFAIGALVAGDVTLDVDNVGTINAMATGLYGQAIALAAYGDGDVTVANSGTVYALATQGAAIGAVVSGYGDIAIDNSGTIQAHAAGETIGLRVDGGGAASVINSGTIAGSIAIEGFDAIEDIRNSGTITGAFDLGGGDDLFSNAEGGAWLLRGNESDFGDGDDAIVNAGTIVLENATIGLGANGEAGNSFTNTGTLVIEGDSHVDMGTGALVAAAFGGASPAPVDVLNPLAFENNGTISFIDGAPDDMLTIAGDFAGEGAINVDVSLLNGTSDMLYIDGNIVSSSVQTLNIALLDMIGETDGIDIPVVAVRGESAAGNLVPGSFNLGTVKWSPSNFVDLDLSIRQHLDASNGDVDMFSLTVVAGGVNETGSLAASIASGAHSLMGAQVGTFRQRMGVFSQLGDSDKGAWVRVFGDKGTIDPDVHLDNLPQGGAFKFDQTNSGIEAGVNALVTDGWYVGASIGGSKGKQDLVDGFGRDDIDGMTLGGYLTWVGAQGYADISYRWMDFDAEMTSAAGVQEVGGNAGAFNVEAGWNAWTSAGGMQLVPQVQYTRTTADVDTVRGEFTDFVADGGTSSRARIGLELQQTFKSGDTTWTPYGVLSAVREMQGEQRFTIGDVFTGHTSTKGTSAQVEFGVNARIGRADVWGGLNWTDGGALDSFIGGQIGVRYTW